MADGLRVILCKRLQHENTLLDIEAVHAAVDDLLDDFEEATSGFYWHLKDKVTSKQEGDIDSIFDDYLKTLGLDAEECLEYYDCLLGDRAEADTAVVRNLSLENR